MEEIWKDINGHEGAYKISSSGKVCSNKYGYPIIMKTFLAGKGYEVVTLCKNGISKKYYIHRLVAIHFIDNSNNYPEVNHIDGNKINNKLINLEWVNGVSNMKHAREKLGFNQKGESSSNAKLTEKNVIDIINMYKTGKYTYSQIAKNYNVHHGHICSIVNRKFWKHLKIK